MQELRQAVMNGADKHPGAVAVEDEFGRVISLGTFNQQVCTLSSHCVCGPTSRLHQWLRLSQGIVLDHCASPVCACTALYGNSSSKLNAYMPCRGRKVQLSSKCTKPIASIC